MGAMPFLWHWTCDRAHGALLRGHRRYVLLWNRTCDRAHGVLLRGELTVTAKRNSRMDTGPRAALCLHGPDWR